MSATVPVLPALEPDLVEQRSLAQSELLTADAELPPARRTVFRRMLRRLTVEGLANAQSVSADPARPLMFPPPRRFVSPVVQQRLRGAAVGFRYVDALTAMTRLPGGPVVVPPPTPLVLNALLAGPVTELETNPGLLRMTSTNWAVDANPFGHPGAVLVPGLVEAAVDMAVRAPAASIARAGWLAFTMMTVHPFVDGNGRTARSLALLVASSDLESAVDWGLIEQWSIDRERYVEALQAGQRHADYDGTKVDPEPFMRFTVTASIRGAVLNTARARYLASLGFDGDELSVELALRSVIDRYVPVVSLLDDAVGSDDDADALAERLDRLVADGVVRYVPSPGGCSPDDPVGRGLAPGPVLEEVATRMRRARLDLGEADDPILRSAP